ncbi:MAG: DUF1552 domain-containing protein, partial [Planctomycetota bacterium]
PAVAPAGSDETRPHRMLAICNNLGLLPNQFFPSGSGRHYVASPYLQTLAKHREDFTVFSGVWHPDVDGGHPADNCFLTAAPHPGSGGFRNTISLDQYIAEQIGHQTRFPSMTWGVNVKQGSRSLSWTGGGVLIPCTEKPSEIYKQLFLKGTPDQVQRQVRRLRLGRSIMDSVADQAKQLHRELGPVDRDRLDQYTTGVRELEKRMSMAQQWEYRPKPEATTKMPLDPEDPREYMDKVRLMYDMAQLVFQTDSSRLVTLMLDSVNSPAIELEEMEVTDGYHSLSHHGKNQQKIDQLEAIDQWHMKLLSDLFDGLKAAPEANQTLMDRTMVLYGSNLGDANTHVTTNLPVLFAGGGFRHGQHLAFDTDNNYPLPNLFVSMLQRMGLPVDRFATSTGTMRGLELAGV